MSNEGFVVVWTKEQLTCRKKTQGFHEEEFETLSPRW